MWPKASDVPDVFRHPCFLFLFCLRECRASRRKSHLLSPRYSDSQKRKQKGIKDGSRLRRWQGDQGEKQAHGVSFKIKGESVGKRKRGEAVGKTKPARQPEHLLHAKQRKKTTFLVWTPGICRLETPICETAISDDIVSSIIRSWHSRKGRRNVNYVPKN